MGPAAIQNHTLPGIKDPNLRLDVRWKECAQNLASALHQAFYAQTWNDVKLVVDNGTCFQASQMVLASASPFLKQILLERNLNHAEGEEPVILLVGVKATTVQDLLTFIYQGEVKLGPTRLTALVALAHMLDIDAIKELEAKRHHPVVYPELSYSSSSKPEQLHPFTGLSLLASAALTAEDSVQHFNDENDPPHVFTPSSNSAVSSAHSGAINLSMKNKEKVNRLYPMSHLLNIPDPNHFKWKRGAFMPDRRSSSSSSGIIIPAELPLLANRNANESPPPLAIDMTSSISATTPEQHPSILPELPATPSPSPSSLVGTPCFSETSLPIEEKRNHSPMLIAEALEEGLHGTKSLHQASTSSNEGKRWKSRQPKLCIQCDRYFSNQFNLKQHILNMHTVSWYSLNNNEA